MSLETEINFTLNGRAVSVRVPVTMKTLAMLRDVLGLTGTKYACGEGECGACTVKVDGKTLNSCLMHAVDCDGREVVTIEGLKTPAGMNPMQNSLRRPRRGAVRLLHAGNDHAGRLSRREQPQSDP